MGGSSSKPLESDDQLKEVHTGTKLEGTDFSGPCENRRCRDVFCMLLLIAAWVAMTGIGFAVTGAIRSDSLSVGNPYRLINGMDYMGNICGIDDVTCGTGDYETFNDDCDSNSKNNYDMTYQILLRPKTYYLPSGGAVCVDECPTEDNYNKFICEYDYSAYLSSVSSEERLLQGLKYVSSAHCMPQVKTVDYVGYCIPEAATDAIETGVNEAAQESDLFNLNITVAGNKDDKGLYEKAQSDAYTAMNVIGGVGMLGTVLFGALYLLLLRFPGCLFCLIWGIIGFITLLLFIPGMMLVTVTYPTWKDDTVHSDNEAKAMLYIGYVFYALSALWLCTVCCLRSRIMLAISITKQASRAVNAMTGLIIFPIAQAIGLLIFMIPWTIFALFLASSGDIVKSTYTTGTTTITYRSFEYTNNMYYAALYFLFVFFWTSQFIVAMGQLVNALAVSTWYFTRDKSTIGNSTVVSSIHKAFRYHMGSAAFGSLIIAIIKTIRAVIMYLQDKAAKSGNKAAQMVLCCLQCCMWCIEKCMKFINKNAYIQIAIFGYSFCKAARCAFFLILRNIATIAAVGLVSEIVTLIGRILVPLMSTFVAYIILNTMSDQLYTLWFPLLLTFLLSYVVSDLFISIFSMAISTILQCFIADKEMFPDDPYAEESLRSCITTTQEKSDSTDHACCSCFNKKADSKVATTDQPLIDPAPEVEVTTTTKE